MQPYTIQHKLDCSYSFTVTVVCDTCKKQLCFLGSHASLAVPIPSPLPQVPGTFCVPIPDPPDAFRITLHLMALHRKLLSTELRRGWHLIRAQERIKGTMLFFLCELDSGFRLQMKRMAWRTGVHLIPWLYPSKHLNIWRLQAGVRFLFGRSFAVDSLLFL